jgi:hypothetical protein
MLPYGKNLKHLARDPRKGQTDAEQRLWSPIRRNSTLAISSGRGKLIEEDFPFGAVKYYLIRVRARVVQIFSRPNGASDEG